ncbi:hypothetical protein ACNSOL_12065 (plasmid) [Aliarcobacter lanthieri]|uniref:hypothetical protein n=1 Tax=Aliarcobacter lanthieri TaxID=1355374 RepID=UPI003AAE38E7
MKKFIISISIILLMVLAISFFKYGDKLKGTVEVNQYKTDFEKWVNDKNFTDGVLYLEGDKGAEVLKREISNCAYVDCDVEEIKRTQGTVVIEVKKPDLKKGVDLLILSAQSGNSLASSKLLTFLVGKINHKTENPDIYLIKQFEIDTGLNYDKYKNVINMAWKKGSESDKCCFCEYLAGELFEYGVLDNTKDLRKAKNHYTAASKICPSNNIYSLLSLNKVKKL